MRVARRSAHIVLLIAACIAAALLLVSCSSAGGAKDGATSGGSFNPPASVDAPIFNSASAINGPSCAIDTSHVSQGYVGAEGTSTTRLKLQVISGERSYNYDIPANGSPIFCPINMGDGAYSFRIMKNTSGSNYVEIASTSINVKLESEFSPYVHPNVYCDFNENSACVALARQLTADSKTQGDALKAICTYVEENIAYDSTKAAELANSTGYIPNPDATLASRTGICFDYASLGAAMLRSVGIPCRIITGYVSPNDIYHAWIMVYIDGTWSTGEFQISSNQWSRVDLTFAASSGDGNKLVGDGKTYTDRYVY